MENNKKCKQCNEIKDKNDFSGRSLRCKYCTNQNSIKMREEKAISEGKVYTYKPLLKYDTNKTSKICTKCNEDKKLSEYYFNNSSKDKCTSRCIKCISRKKVVSYEDTISKICNTCNTRKDLIEFQKDKGCRLGYKNKCKKCTSISKHSYMKGYVKNRIEIDFLFKLKKNLRTSILNSIKKKGYSKISKTHQILGCNFNDFKIHIESQFTNWMSWDNHGKYNGELDYGWDLDHIIPLSSAKTEEDIIKLNHYSNFQPLCSFINRNIKRDLIMY
jgi:hypothetical protein